jgi:hypothetical protein
MSLQTYSIEAKDRFEVTALNETHPSVHSHHTPLNIGQYGNFHFHHWLKNVGIGLTHCITIDP